MKKRKLLSIFIVLIIIIVAAIWLWQRNADVSDNSLTNIKKRGVLVVGSDIPYGIMEFFDQNNKPAGVDVDIAQEIASQLGVRLEFNDYDWDQIFPLVKNGGIDLAISSITITPERQQEMIFSNPYFNGGQVIVARSDNQDIKGINDLDNRKVAVQGETTGYTEAQKCTAEDLIFTYSNFESSANGEGIVSDLRNSKFEAIIVDYVQALDLIKNNSDLKIIGVPFTRESYGIATKIGNDSLMKKVNFILQKMKDDGKLKSIELKWTAF